VLTVNTQDPVNVTTPSRQHRPARVASHDNRDDDAIDAGWTRIRIVDDDGGTVGIVWTKSTEDDELRALIPDGCKAMLRRGRRADQEEP